MYFRVRSSRQAPRDGVPQHTAARPRKGSAIPPEVAVVRDAIPALLQAAALAMSSRNSAQLDQALQALDASPALIEALLAR